MGEFTDYIREWLRREARKEQHPDVDASQLAPHQKAILKETDRTKRTKAIRDEIRAENDGEDVPDLGEGRVGIYNPTHLR